MPVVMYGIYGRDGNGPEKWVFVFHLHSGVLLFAPADI